ncbi:hypothetical protein NPIL_367081 [Nephila pilipes]|uniref:Uncharacterized protein n=1 Tax=Nephila pilipes TaxID=299642 RepID=A0A8X6T317_NEPPI|nr:hypothetical protein NPIL_367081 [Nephila pilipes]
MAHSREHLTKPYAPKRSLSESRSNQAGSTSSFIEGNKLKINDRSERPSISFYGCSKPGVTNPRCPNCKPTANKDWANFNNISLHSCFSTPYQSTALKLAVNGTWGTVCADTAASHSIDGETCISFYRERESTFRRLDSLCPLMTAISLRWKPHNQCSYQT